MNLLKVLMLVCLATSLSLLIPVTARATDHPWDHETVDSTSLGNPAPQVVTMDNDGIQIPRTAIPFVQRVANWVRGKLKEVGQFFLGQDKQEIRGTVVNRDKRSETPSAYRRHSDSR
jgi:hypothetical protein